MDEKIKALNSELKELKEKKTNLGSTIIDLMQKNKVEHCNLPNNEVLLLKKSITYSSIKKEDIQDAFKEILKKPISQNPEKIAEETTESLFNNRDFKENLLLKKIKSK